LSYLSGDLFLTSFKTRKDLFPIHYAAAMDILPIQASAVSCERVFSSAAETDTKHCNRLGAQTMEALQMLKFMRKKDRLNFTKGWVTEEDHLMDSADENEPLLEVFDAEEVAGGLGDGIQKHVKVERLV
jgi:hypothetical protein